MLGGDFRQTSPVKKASKPEIVDASITRSYLWPDFKTYTLKENMRLYQSGITEAEKMRIDCFSRWLLDIGNSTIGELDVTDSADTFKVELPTDVCHRIGLNSNPMTEASKSSLNPGDKWRLPLVEATPISVAELRPTHKNKMIEVRVYHKWIAQNVKTQEASNFCVILLDIQGNAIQANMNLKDTEYFYQLLQLNNAYRISRFICTATKLWDRTLPNPTTLLFGRYTNIILISNANFPYHYFRGDATRMRRTRRVIDIQNLDGIILPFLIWGELAEGFDIDEYAKLQKPVIIAVSLQLSATSATYYYLNLNIPEANHILSVLAGLINPIPTLEIQKAPYTSQEEEQMINRHTIESLLTVNPQHYEIIAPNGWYYKKCNMCNIKVFENKDVPQCHNHVPQPIPNYGRDGTATTTITCFSPEAHTFVPDCNTIGNSTEGNDTNHIPAALKEAEGQRYIFKYRFGKKAKPGNLKFTLDAALKPITTPLLALPATETTTSPFAERLEEPSGSNTPTAKDEEPSLLAKNNVQEATENPEAKKKTARWALFQEADTQEKKPKHDMDEYVFVICHSLVTLTSGSVRTVLQYNYCTYDQMIDYAIWKVIENGATLSKTQVVEGVTKEVRITTAEEKAQRRLEVKARINNAQAVNTAHEVSTASTQVNVAYSKNIDNLSDVVICSFFASKPNSRQLVHEDLEQIHPDDMKKMNLRWQMAMLTIRAKRFLKKTGRKLTVNGNDTIGSDKSKVECYNCHNSGHFARECRALRNQDNKHKETSRRSVPVETFASIALVSCDGLGGYDWSDQAKEGPNYALMAFSSSSSDSKIVNNSKKGLGYENYNAVLPPYTGNFMPLTPDLSYTGLDEFVNKLVFENCKAISSEEEPKVVRKNDDASIIEELVSDDEEENVSQPKVEKQTVRPSIVKKVCQI
nr:hypothetical protein [Tanacetum cinerariifolium]